jgi:DNA repair exonuclease SbcCD ATPase subunit
LEQECSNKVQRLQELEVLSDSLEHKNQSLERELATCRDRRNELEKLLDESALEVNKIQKRHEEQLEEVQSQLADKESSSALQVNKIQKLHGEQLGEIQSQLADKELALHDFKSRDRSCQAEKENKRLRETVQEQKRVLSDLESELRQERNVASLPKPGDFLRMAKQRDGEGFARDNALLKLRNKGGC